MQTQTPIQCPACGHPFTAAVYNVVDVVQEPQAKAMLLSGQLNMPQCPQCGTQTAIAAPLLYHDSTKEMLIALVPMELNLPKDQQEKVIGDLMNRLPKENFKSYMFNPRRALTMQWMIDQILEADGITPEMMQEQRDRVRLAQQFVEAEEDELNTLIKEHNDKIDMQFLQTLTMMAQRALEAGRQDIAQSILMSQNYVVENSTFGQELIRQQEQQEHTMQQVADDIEALGAGATREDFLKLAIDYAGDEQRLQAFVGLIRPALDYEFFQLFTAKINESPAEDQDTLNELRQNLLDFTALIDQQTQMAMQNAAGFLQALLNHPQPEALIRENLEVVDDTFMAVLSANIDQAEKQQNIQAAAKLKNIYNMVVSVLQNNMNPELRFVNELLSAPTEAEATSLLNERAEEFGDDLLEVMDAIEQVLGTQGGDPQMIKRLQALKNEAQAVLKA